MAKHNNQLTAGDRNRGDIGEEVRPDWIACGGVVPLFEVENNREMGGALALGGCGLMTFHTTTNQKWLSGIEGSMEGSCNEREAWGSTIPLFWGRWKLNKM